MFLFIVNHQQTFSLTLTIFLHNSEIEVFCLSGKRVTIHLGHVDQSPYRYTTEGSHVFGELKILPINTDMFIIIVRSSCSEDKKTEVLSLII